MLALRPARPQDAPPLQRHCWPERTPEAAALFLERALSDLAGRQRGYVLVAHIDEQAIGFGLLTRWRDVGEISDLVVAEAWRGEGIGAAMIRHLTVIAAEHYGLPFAEIGVAQRNTRAYALYQRLGFAWHRTVALNLGEGLEYVDYLLKQLKPAQDWA